MQDAFEDWMDGLSRELGATLWFDAKVAGVTQPGRQEAIRTLAPCDELVIEPEPSNPFDPNAVAVRTATGEQIGYLDRRCAADITRELRKGTRVRCFVRCLREGKGCCGICIALLQFRC